MDGKAVGAKLHLEERCGSVWLSQWCEVSGHGMKDYHVLLINFSWLPLSLFPGYVWTSTSPAHCEYQPAPTLEREHLIPCSSLRLSQCLYCLISIFNEMQIAYGN